MTVVVSINKADFLKAERIAWVVQHRDGRAVKPRNGSHRGGAGGVPPEVLARLGDRVPLMQMAAWFGPEFESEDIRLEDLTVTAEADGQSIHAFVEIK